MLNTMISLLWHYLIIDFRRARESSQMETLLQNLTPGTSQTHFRSGYSTHNVQEIWPTFDYCDFIYYCISSYNQEMLQKLQNCALKWILRVDRLTSTDFIYEVLSMDTLANRQYKQVAVRMYRYTHNLAPPHCCNMLTRLTEQHDKNTRSLVRNNLNIAKMNLTVGQHNIRYYGVKIWLKVDLELRQSDSLNKF